LQPLIEPSWKSSQLRWLLSLPDDFQPSWHQISDTRLQLALLGSCSSLLYQLFLVRAPRRKSVRASAHRLLESCPVEPIQKSHTPAFLERTGIGKNQHQIPTRSAKDFASCHCTTVHTTSYRTFPLLPPGSEDTKTPGQPLLRGLSRSSAQKAAGRVESPSVVHAVGR